MTKGKMKIYTKTGDRGETSLFGGKRLPKSDFRVEAYGSVDELNSAIGVTIAQYQKSNIKNQKYILKIKNELIKIQNDLLHIGSVLASPFYSSSEASLKAGESRSYNETMKQLNNQASSRQARTIYFEKRTKKFEQLIDEMTVQMPVLKQFILPGGGEVGSQLHVCRTVCRRAERRIVELTKKEQVDNSIVQYFNRLSDLLFTMARFVNLKEKKKEVIWVKPV